MDAAVNQVPNFPETRMVHCPSGPTNACESHAAGVSKLMSFMGAHVTHTKAEPGAQCDNCVSEFKSKLKLMLQPRMLDPSMPDHCMCNACKDGITLHKSDCAVHNEPAYPNGPCDCMPRVAAKCPQ
jgi:hypothetical protein